MSLFEMSRPGCGNLISTWHFLRIFAIYEKINFFGTGCYCFQNFELLEIRQKGKTNDKNDAVLSYIFKKMEKKNISDDFSKQILCKVCYF